MASTTADLPSHVEPGSVIDFDVYADSRFLAEGDIHCSLYRMSEVEGRGIFWTPRHGGHWFINDHALLFEAMQDTELFSSASQNLPPMPEGQEPRVLPVSLDGEEHTAYRLPLLKAFAPVKVKAMQSDIRDFAIELIEKVQSEGQCDFIDAIAEPLPVVIFMRFMGLDTTRLREFRSWISDMLSPDDERRATSHTKILAMLTELVAERRAEPRDDLISRLLAGEVYGRPIDQEELLAYCLLLFAAGLDTVANALAFGMNHLAHNAELQEQLRARPELIPAALEELLRLHGIANLVRRVTRDTHWHGVDLKKGDHVLMLLAAGNYDGQTFAEPGSFVLEREGEPHITFGIGPHRCVGSHLARLELNTFLVEWFRRMPNVALAPDAKPVMRGGQTFALGALPLVWEAAEVQMPEGVG